MYGPRIVSGLAALFGGIAVLFAVFGVVANLVFFGPAFIFGAAAYLMWYHASGRFARRLYRGVEDRASVDERVRGGRAGPDGRGGFGAGPREEWTPPRDEQRRRARAGAQRADGAGAARGARGGRRAPTADDGPTVAQAYERLGLEPGADEETVRRAYREKVKEVHPDSATGDEEAFKEVKTAYERLTDD